MLLSLLIRIRYLFFGIYLFSFSPHLGLLNIIGVDLSGTALKTMYAVSFALGMVLILIRKFLKLVICSLLLLGAYAFYNYSPIFGEF
jgi:hypothetical protein